MKTFVTLIPSPRGMVRGFGGWLPHSNSDEFLERCKGRVPDELLTHLEVIFTIVQFLTQQIEGYGDQIEKLAAEQYP